MLWSIRVSGISRILLTRHCSTFVTAPTLHSWLSAAPTGTTNSKKVQLVDVRSPEDYSKAHLPNAVNCHAIFTYLSTNSDESGAKDLAKTFQNLFQEAGICGDEHVITYEHSLENLYGASCRGYYLLRLLGHPKVSILSGGFKQWVELGYPTSSGVTQVAERGTFQADWTASMWSDRDEIKKAIKDGSSVLLDVRDLDEWTGTSSSPYGIDFTPRKGRLPGAVHILWRDFMEPSGEDGMMQMKSGGDILKMCAEKGVTPDKKIIVYCFKGARASNTFIALKKAGFKYVKNYFASWNEWSRNPELEIDSKILQSTF